MIMKPILPALVLFTLAHDVAGQTNERPRARDLGVRVGVFTPGPLNAITDVAGVLVGQVTVQEGDRINTGITAIRPHGGSIYHERVPAAIYVGNGFGKLLGVTQVRELGELETPILLTCTLCVWKAADAMVEWALELDGMERVGSLNAVVGETNDGGLNDIRSRPITAARRSGGPRDRQFRSGGGRLGGSRPGNASVWLEGRDRNQQPHPPGEPGQLHGRRTRPIELRRDTHDGRRAGRQGARPLLLPA